VEYKPLKSVKAERDNSRSSPFRASTATSLSVAQLVSRSNLAEYELEIREQVVEHFLRSVPDFNGWKSIEIAMKVTIVELFKMGKVSSASTPWKKWRHSHVVRERESSLDTSRTYQFVFSNFLNLQRVPCA
jgi:hypothetical protein